MRKIIKGKNVGSLTLDIVMNKALPIFLFFVIFLFSFVSAVDNSSIMYGQNSSGALVPLQTTDDGTLKVEMDFMNVTAGDISSSGNLSLGQKISFALGGVIDNIVSGWIGINTGLNLSSGNFSLGGKILSNDNGTLKWGGIDVDTNVSILHGVNDSGSVVGLSVDSDRKLNLKITSLKSGVWEVVGGIVQLVNPLNVTVDGTFIATSNGVGINSKVSMDVGYNVTSADRNRIIALNSSAVNDTTFMLPSVSASNDGEIYRFLNDAEYTLTIKPNGTDAIWNSGSGYGIDLPDKGTMVSLRYDSFRNKWDILQKTGGKVLIEGLVLMEPMFVQQEYDVTSSTVSVKLDETERHLFGNFNGVIMNNGNPLNLGPGYWEFQGVNQYSSAPDSTDWDIFGTNESGHKTVGFWVYFNKAAGSVNATVGQYEGANDGWWLYRHTTGALRLLLNDGADIDINGGSLPATTWTHIAMVIDGPDVGLYINGSQVVYDGTWNADTFSGALYIGQKGSGSTFLNGRMQDLHISYNNPYNANPNSGSTDSFTVPNAPFVGVME